MGGSIFVTSFKGGVGKTTVCANLAGALCNLGHTVLIVDGDFGMRCMDIVLGLENEALFDLGDVLDGRVELERAVLQSQRVPSLSFLPAPMNCRVPPARTAVAEVIGTLRQSYDYVLIDSSAEESETTALSPLRPMMRLSYRCTSPRPSARRKRPRSVWTGTASVTCG